MDKYYAYILQSQSAGMNYVGSTHDLANRVRHHNDPDNPKHKTTGKFKGPWELVYHEEYPTRSEAMIREKKIKSWKSRRMITKLIDKSRPSRKPDPCRD